MADGKDVSDKKPGEHSPGKFHYNPGNMAGKTVNDTAPPPDAGAHKKPRKSDRRET